MSGHNKWSTIKHKKGRADARRGKLFTKLIRELTVATREGGKDADANPRLRSAILTARTANMPNDTITRAVKRGSGEIEGEIYEEASYEGYGPGGVAFFIEALTTNKNRTVADVRHALAKRGGNLGTDGSVAWMFDVRGLVEVEAEGVDFDSLFEDAAEAGADDLEAGEAVHSVYCAFTDLAQVSGALEAKYTVITSKKVRLPTTEVSVTGKAAETILNLMEALDDLDDVQNVYTNADISEEEMLLLSS